jgi:hypothetical protein
MKIWLDDERPPPDNTWQFCWNLYSVIQVVRRLTYPEHISFDHDLGEESTGCDVARWLIERDIEWHDMPANFGYTVHSRNPVGAENIKGVMDRYLRFKQEKECYVGQFGLSVREEKSNSV